ncbi:SDR family NAD(P)-dependent oxidoreductase [Hirschia maritima]|uniref:SDR family NAD(P)-dependent oxidoreductase n=1 Tax=Hirschia maritima TaxID=1121961 RepID=UPI00037A3F78|nr:SDR family oxidoreductase [Hirschia maritima]
MSGSEETRPLVLITGASAGIGEALAQLYASKKYDVFLVARREEKLASFSKQLSKTHSINAMYFACDLSKPESPNLLLNQLRDRKLHVDVLINNAGFGLAPEFTNTSWAEQASFLQLMLNTPCELCHALLPAMRKQGHGSIINIASLAGYAPPGPGHTLYAASKAALIKFTQSLYLENKKYGLNIVAVCPGLTYSEFHDVNGQRDKLQNLPKFLWQTSDQVAQACFKAGNSKRAVHIPGLVNKALYTLNKLLPQRVSTQILKARHR